MSETTGISWTRTRETMTFTQWWQSVAYQRMQWSRYTAAENAWIAGVLAEQAAAPPLPADIEAALELAKRLMRDDLLVPTTPCEEQLALALLKSHGKLP